MSANVGYETKKLAGIFYLVKDQIDLIIWRVSVESTPKSKRLAFGCSLVILIPSSSAIILARFRGLLISIEIIDRLL